MFYVSRVFYYLEAQSYLCVQERFNVTDWFVLERTLKTIHFQPLPMHTLHQPLCYNTFTHINLQKIKNAKRSIKHLIFNSYTSYSQMWLH